MRYLRVFSATLIFAFLFCAPAPLMRALKRNPMRELFEIKNPEWYGVIEIWHIAGFRTYQGSVTNFLQDCCDTFSRKHPGVHIEVKGMTPAMYEERAARGLVPDAYSFPAGSLSKKLFRELSADTPILREGFSFSDTNTARLAAPYLMSGYFLLLNEQHFITEDRSLPDSVNDALLQRLHGENQLAVPETLSDVLDLTSTSVTYNDFLGGKCAAAIADARSLGDLMRSTEQNLLVTALPMNGYTDQVMYFGAAIGTDDHRAALIDELYAYLLSESVQQQLSKIGAMPVRKYLDNMVYHSQLLTDWNQYYHASASVKGAFAE